MTISYNASIVRNGLISQIDFANPKIGNTNTKTNLVFGANNFVGQNSPAVSNGIFSSDGLNPGSTFREDVVGTGLGNHGTGSFTYQFLINPKSSTSIESAAEARIYEQGGWPDTYHIFRIMHNGGNRYYDYIFDDLTDTIPNFGIATPAGTAILNQWVFLTAMIDRGTGHGRIYINDTKYETAQSFSTAEFGNNDPLSFPSSYAEIQADYSCVLIYNRALSDNEVLKNYNAVRERVGI
jgi:hypothetical protein